jgi:hypothetical protein
MWNSLDLLETLVELGSDELTEPIVRQILDFPVKHVPELITLAFVQIKVPISSATAFVIFFIILCIYFLLLTTYFIS